MKTDLFLGICDTLYIFLHLFILQQQVCLRPRGEYLALAVPGLAEGRPSVLVGDKIYLSTPGDEESGPQYEGYVHEVLKFQRKTVAEARE